MLSRIDLQSDLTKKQNKRGYQISHGTLKIKRLCVLHLASFQIKQQDLFDEWVSKLRHHRIYRQNEIATYEKTFHYPHYQCPNSPSMSDSASIRKV